MVYLRTGSSDGLAGFIGREITKDKWVTVASNGEHAVVELEGRFYDAFTGPGGETIKEYMSKIASGARDFPVKVLE